MRKVFTFRVEVERYVVQPSRAIIVALRR